MRYSSFVARRAPFTLALAMAALSWGARPATAQETVLQDVRFGSDTMLYQAPRVIVRGSRLSEAELKRLLDPGANEPWAERVKRLEAEEMLAPELVATVKTPQLEQRSVYRDVSVKRISGGRIASITTVGGTVEGKHPNGKGITGSNGPISMQDIDVGAAFALLNSKAGPSEPLRRIYGAFSMEALKVVDEAGITTQIGRISGRDFSAKPTSLGWMETINAMAAAEAAKGSPAALRRSMDALAEFVDAIAVGTIEASDISVKGRVEKDDVDLNISMKKVAYVGSSAGRPGEMKVEGSLFEAGGARVSYETMTFGGLDAKPAMEALREISLNPDNPSPAVLRRMLPMISTIRLDNIQVDAPETGAKSSQLLDGPRVKFGLGRFEIVAEKPINGIPTDMRISIRDLDMPVPPNPDNEGLAMLSQLGYGRLAGSFAFNLGWNEPGQELVIRDVSLDGKDMGTATIRGVIGKVGRDVFNMDTAVAGVALASAAAKSLELTLDNRGLFERVIAREARRQKRQPEDIRREYGMAASIGIPAILGSGQNAKALAQAVSRFVAKPGKLTVQARARQQGGYGLADYMANPTPSGVLEALDVTAVAE